LRFERLIGIGIAKEREEREFIEYRKVSWEEIEYKRVRRIGYLIEELIGRGEFISLQFWFICIRNRKKGSL
jgi:hypothetical protein